MTEGRGIFTKEFIALNVIMFLSFCNLAIFFQFYNYLYNLHFDPRSIGLLISCFSFTVLIIRPLISPFFGPANAKKWIAISSVLVIASLLAYNLAYDFWSMAVVRLLHGAAYVILATAVTAKLVDAIPGGRSGQAFGLISVITLLPYAVVPPIIEPLILWTGGFDRVLNLSAALMGLSFLLLVWISSDATHGADESGKSLSLDDVLANLKSVRVLLLLWLSFSVWTSFTPVFFYLKSYGDKIGIPNPGWFFTLSTFMEIGVRVIAGSVFDKLSKPLLLAGSLVWLAIGYIILPFASGSISFFGLGLFLGLGWGVAMPVVSGLVFDVSEPKFRALNTNLSFEMFQAGFFVGPLVGGAMLVNGNYSALYCACGLLSLVSVPAALVLSRKRESLAST
jgi:predicted MFS family arabinose efflux permease